MFRHLLKLTWKRKTRNLMLSLEILLAFVVVFVIAALAVRGLQLYRMPLGFDSRDVWSVSMQPPSDGKIEAAAYDAIRRGVLELPEVTQVAFATFAPYSMSSMDMCMKGPDGARMCTGMIDASDELAQALGLHLSEGRWFSPLDNGDAAQPVVIDRDMANALFRGKSAVGRQFTDPDSPGDKPYRVVGVVEQYRAGGELSAPANFTFVRFVPGGGMRRSARTMILELRAGTGRSFEARLNQRLKLVRNDWTFQIAPLSADRSAALKARFIPVIVLGVIAAFMLLMVAFGLFGALWQNTTRRIPEIGLRRAVGAEAGDIYRQVVAEQLLLSSVAIAAALVLLVQLPLTGALGANLDWTVFGAAAGLSMLVIYLLSLLCALYPGWRASRLSPVEALHYE